MVGRGLSVAALLAIAITQPGPARADDGDTRRFGADDLVRMEAFAGARFDRTGRWAVWERRGRYDQAATYAYATLTADLLTDVIVVDVTGVRPDRVIGETDDAGYRAGPISPDSRRMVIHRLTPDGRTLGVLTFETGDVAWFDLSADLAILGRTVAWRNDDEIVAILTPDGEQPLYYRLGWQAQSVTALAWADALKGTRPTATMIWSGSARSRRPQRAPARLVSLTIDTGAVRTWMRGEFYDLEIAPGGAVAAVMENAEDLQPEADRLAIGDPTRRRRLQLVDFETGQVLTALPDRDLISHLLSWSMQGDRLLVFSRTPGGDWADGAFHVVARDGRATTLDLGGARPAILRVSGERIPIVRGGWLDDAPAVLVERSDGRRPWRDTGSGREIEGDAHGRLVRLDGAIWFDTAEGLAPWGGVATTGLRPAADGGVSDGGSRAAWNPSSVVVGAVVDGRGCLSDGAAAPPFCPGTTGRRIAAAPGGAVHVETGADGATRVRLATPQGDRLLGLLNAELADVAWGRIHAIDHEGLDGGRLTSWLLLPPGQSPTNGWPLAVMIYPGHVHREPPAMLAPGAGRTQISPQVLSGGGYAVLVPSLPLGPAEDGTLADLSRSVDLAVDAALAADLGSDRLDGRRLGLLGHSYGGHGALVVATRTGRYGAVVATAGMADYAAGIGDTLHFATVPADGVLSNAVIGYFESGQGAMGVPPWQAPDVWTAASPLYAADRIRSPTLLVWGDLDPVSADTLFAALYRLNREAALVTYRGEGHVLVSPANIVDLHGRILDWLDERLEPRSETLAPVPDP